MRDSRDKQILGFLATQFSFSSRSSSRRRSGGGGSGYAVLCEVGLGLLHGRELLVFVARETADLLLTLVPDLRCKDAKVEVEVAADDNAYVPCRVYSWDASSCDCVESWFGGLWHGGRLSSSKVRCKRSRS